MNSQEVDYIGDDAYNMLEDIRVAHPLATNVIDWDDLELIWHHTFSLLKTDPSECLVFMTEFP